MTPSSRPDRVASHYRAEHVRSRFRERYGMEASREDVRAWEVAIREARPWAVPLRVAEGGRELFAVWDAQAGWFPVVYSWKLGEICTVLPMTELATSQARLDAIALAGQEVDGWPVSSGS